MVCYVRLCYVRVNARLDLAQAVVVFIGLPAISAAGTVIMQGPSWLEAVISSWSWIRQVN